MPFDPNSAKKAGKKPKRRFAKKEVPSIKEKLAIPLLKSAYGQYLLNLVK